MSNELDKLKSELELEMLQKMKELLERGQYSEVQMLTFTLKTLRESFGY